MKSMLLALAISLSAATASAGWMEIKELDLYKEAVIDAFNRHSGEWTCTGAITENGTTTPKDPKNIQYKNLPTILRHGVQAGWISSDSSQPLLFFKYKGSEGNLHDLYIYTDETRTQMTKFSANGKIVRVERRNVGTIDKPIFQDVEVEKRSTRMTCQ